MALSIDIPMLDDDCPLYVSRKWRAEDWYIGCSCRRLHSRRCCTTYVSSDPLIPDGVFELHNVHLLGCSISCLIPVSRMRYRSSPFPIYFDMFLKFSGMCTSRSYISPIKRSEIITHALEMRRSRCRRGITTQNDRTRDQTSRGSAVLKYAGKRWTHFSPSNVTWLWRWRIAPISAT